MNKKKITSYYTRSSFYKLFILTFFLASSSSHSFAQIQDEYFGGFIIGFSETSADEDLANLQTEYPDLKPLGIDFMWAENQLTVLAFEEELTIRKKEALLEQLLNDSKTVFVSKLILKGSTLGGLLPEFYVQLHTSDDLPLLQDLAKRTGTKIVKESSYKKNFYILKANKFSKTSRVLAKEFEASALFKKTGYNSLFSLQSTTDDPLYNFQWALKNNGTSIQGNGTIGADINIEAAWEITTGNPFIKIAVLDSGVDTLHPDLINNLLPGFDPLEEVSNGAPNLDLGANAHGTACTGIVVAEANNDIAIAGIAHSCKVVPVRIFRYLNLGGTPTPITNTQTLFEAVNLLLSEDIDVATSSAGLRDEDIPLLSMDTALINSEIVLAAQNGRNGKGIPILFSSGNDNTTSLIWPARIDQTIAVGATSMCDERKNPDDCSTENWGCDYGLGLSVSAPGVKIATTDLQAPNGYLSSSDYTLSFNGTSAACPMAAGVMALILSVNNELTAQEARHILQASCDKVGGYDYSENYPSGSWSQELGYGRINAHTALVMAQESVRTTEIYQVEDKLQIYPNPFQKQTTIQYELVQAEKVSLTIYNQLGQKIKVLSNALQQAGQHTIEWNGTNDKGVSLSKGIYFLELKNGENIHSTKLILTE